MPRKPRRAPKREKDPLDDYSAWNIRTAKAFFISFVGTTIVLVMGLWIWFVEALVVSGTWETFLNFSLSLQVFIITAAVVGHLFLLVLFYILFSGGKLKILKILFKDRLIAKKYEDFQALRLLIGVTLLGVYIMVVSLLIWVLPLAFFEVMAEFWVQFFATLNIGQWILVIGAYGLVIIFIIFFCFVLWNHGVYWVLKKVKNIEEETEIKDEIHVEKLQEMDEEELHEEYHKQTGRNAIYRGKETKGYKEWRAKRLSK